MNPQFINLGLNRFLDVQKIQLDLLEKRKKGFIPDTLIISQFCPVITLGRGAKSSDILADKEIIRKEKIEIHKINRGGGVTIHLPGQWVIYPIIDLNSLGKDISFFIRFLEEWVIDFLSVYRIKSERRGSLPGVWVEDRKICFIGIGVSKWVSFHGLSLNIEPDLKYFSYINPCGIKSLRVTSLKAELGTIPDYTGLEDNLKSSFKSVIEKKGYVYEAAC